MTCGRARCDTWIDVSGPSPPTPSPGRQQRGWGEKLPWSPPHTNSNGLDAGRQIEASRDPDSALEPH